MYCYFNFSLIGALTTKPSVFGARVWELEKNETIDFLDNLGSTVYIEMRGGDIIRVLPKINVFGNSEWISDRIRFFFDSLEIQNLYSPYFYDKITFEYKIVDWSKALNYFKHISVFYFKNKFMNQIGNVYYLNNEDTDLLSLVACKLFLNNFSFVSFYTYALYENRLLNIDFMNNFCFFDSLDCLVEAIGNVQYANSFLFFFGYNIRCEHPLLFFRLNEAVKLKKLKIFVFGVAYGLHNMYKTIGLTVKDFIKFFYFKNNALNIYLNQNVKQKLNNFLFIYGVSFINRSDFSIYDLFLKKFFILLKMNKIKYIYKYIVSAFNDLNSTYVGYKSSFKNNFLKFNLKGNVDKAINFLNFDRTSFFFKNLMNFFFSRMIVMCFLNCRINCR